MIFVECFEICANFEIVRNAVLLYAMEALGGRGGIAPTLS
jgi:hypothetical protein